MKHCSKVDFQFFICLNVSYILLSIGIGVNNVTFCCFEAIYMCIIICVCLNVSGHFTGNLHEKYIFWLY